MSQHRKEYLRMQSRLAFFLVFMICFLACSALHAQNTVTSTQLLTPSPNGKLSGLLQKNIEFLKNGNQSLPLIEKMEFRTETDELNLRRQEYVFRMSFNGKKSRKVQDQLTQSSIQINELKDQLLQKEILEDRYEYIAEWFYIEQEIQSRQAEQIIHEDKLKVYQRMLTNTPEIDISNILKAEEDLQDIERDILQLNQKKQYIIQLLLPEEKNAKALVDTSNWVSLETMQRLLTEIKDQPVQNLEQALQLSQVNFAQLEYDLEKADGKRVFDFAQIKYAGRDKLDFYREWSLGLGINIPTKSSNRVDINEAQLEIFQEEFQLAALELDIEEELILRYNQFENAMNEYELIKTQIVESELAKIYEKYRTISGVHPLTLLQLKENLLEKERDLIRLEKDCCLVFLEILELKGKLSTTPAVNYLSDDLSEN